MSSTRAAESSTVVLGVVLGVVESGYDWVSIVAEWEDLTDTGM
jgi:hypothetical protein